MFCCENTSLPQWVSHSEPPRDGAGHQHCLCQDVSTAPSKAGNRVSTRSPRGSSRTDSSIVPFNGTQTLPETPHGTVLQYLCNSHPTVTHQEFLYNVHVLHLNFNFFKSTGLLLFQKCPFWKAKIYSVNTNIFCLYNSQ